MTATCPYCSKSFDLPAQSSRQRPAQSKAAPPPTPPPGKPLTLLAMNWTEAKAMKTQRGDRILRTAPVIPAFWNHWEHHKAQLQSQGYSVKKDDVSGEWTVCHWAEIGVNVIVPPTPAPPPDQPGFDATDDIPF